MTHSTPGRPRSLGMQDDVFQIGVTRDLVRPDGTLVFAPIGFEALDRPGLVCTFLEEDGLELTADQLVGLDALVHFSPSSARPRWRAWISSR